MTSVSRLKYVYFRIVWIAIHCVIITGLCFIVYSSYDAFVTTPILTSMDSDNYRTTKLNFPGTVAFQNLYAIFTAESETKHISFFLFLSLPIFFYFLFNPAFQFSPARRQRALTKDIRLGKFFRNRHLFHQPDKSQIRVRNGNQNVSDFVCIKQTHAVFVYYMKRGDAYTCARYRCTHILWDRRVRLRCFGRA